MNSISSNTPKANGKRAVVGARRATTKPAVSDDSRVRDVPNVARLQASGWRLPDR
jgi:hypothetical protein